MKQLFFPILMAALLVINQGCNKQLDLYPADKLPTADALKTIQGVNAAVNGMYEGLKVTEYYGRNYLVIPEIAADNVYLSFNNSNRFLSSWRLSWVVADGDVTGVWNRVYAVILRANNIINSVPLLEDGTTEEKNSALGQALFVRALGHFDLLRVFSTPYAVGGGGTLGVPLITKFEVGSPKRNTVDEVYKQIIADLTTAKDLLPKSRNTPYSASSYAATALLARVHLYKGEDAAAITAATEVINAGYSIAPANTLANFYNTPGTTEDIFTIRILSNETLGSDNLGRIYLKPGYGDVRVSPDLKNVLEANDARNVFVSEFSGSPAEFQNNKFTGQDGISGLYSIKVLRISELYLIRAEAYAKTGSYALALADVNEIRAHRNLPALENVPDANVLTAVLKEKRVEFMFEGHRYFDLLRNKLSIVRTTCNNPAQLNTPRCTIEASSPTAIFPIPQREIDVNLNIEQNPGYKK
ncbi:RagB/SusD family nutrient uptake outer membrane protein [Chitinophaga pinensis]|uniref:RagB/SusD domain protein n=1 Tax=Chitinophaga pinensis (strain ATCC 43595 / DSM 2588 / LMG 13176 / NBRC 15968 / NCIMB 11800 / UQM 2034) TaxID=485918 RepID=A0A979GQT1_CHIPD|nr:RagB/SusD family nutrient uptake outer membrane protein [Chitinophaga pinensis]ACU57951.1 RagB/SusD domain protein [Chitinophaga pinensis DSM 2588]